MTKEKSSYDKIIENLEAIPGRFDVCDKMRLGYISNGMFDLIYHSRKGELSEEQSKDATKKIVRLIDSFVQNCTCEEDKS